MGLAATLLQFVDQRLDQMLEAPAMWGADESVELQVLQLLEIRALIVAAPDGQTDWRQVQAAYERFLDERFPGSPPATLAVRLGSERHSEHSSLLAAFVAAHRERHPARSIGDANHREIDAIEQLLTAAHAAWEAGQGRRDTFGSRPVRLTAEVA